MALTPHRRDDLDFARILFVCYRGCGGPDAAFAGALRGFDPIHELSGSKKGKNGHGYQ